MTIKDSSWVFSSLLIPDSALETPGLLKHRYWTPGRNKFVDTQLGGHFIVNPPPQFTRYADPRIMGTGPNRLKPSIYSGYGDYGLGHYYDEAIDSPSTRVYFRMGVPQFTSLLTFLSNSFDPGLATLVKTGKARSIWLQGVELITSAIPILAFPLASTLYLGGKALSAVFTRPTSKYYTMKPTMYVYWRTVDMLINTLAVNLGILPRFMMPDKKKDLDNNKSFIDKDFLDHLHTMMPDVFTKNYGINTYALVNKAQRRYNAKFTEDYNKLNNASATSYDDYLSKLGTDQVPNVPAPNFMKTLNAMLMGSYWLEDTPPPVGDEAKNFTGTIATDPTIDPATGEFTEHPPEKANILNYFDAEMREGSQFACFRFDQVGTISESFSNSVGEPEIASKLNSTVSTVREIKFGLAGGNIVGGNMVGDAIQAVGGLIKDTAEAALSGVTLGLSNVVSQFFAGAYMDIPNTWKNSSAKLPSIQYTTTLISPYKNVVNRIQNIHLPISMFLAMALPRSTGKTSYESPFLVQVFHRGHNQVSTGLIESLTFTRGTANLPFSPEGDAMAIEVSLSIVDLSTIMHMPVDTSGIFGGSIALDEDNTLYQYLATLAALDIGSQIYTFPKAKLNAAKRAKNLDTFWSTAHWSMLGADLLGGILPIDKLVYGRQDIMTDLR